MINVRKFWLIIISIILALSLGISFYYTHSIKGLGSQGDNLTDRLTHDMERFLRNPGICKSENIDNSVLKAISDVSADDLSLIIKLNALPKRIDFYVQRKSTNRLFAEIIYHPDRGCNGIFLHLNLIP